MSDTNNPLYQVYNALWTLLESESSFTSLVPAGPQRVKYTSTTDRLPRLDGGLTADYPMVEIVLLGMRTQAHATSNGSLIVARWGVNVLAGDRRMGELFDVTFAVYKALVNWQAHVKDFTYDGTAFHVGRCKALDVNEAIHPGDGIAGWVSVWQGETDIWLSTQALLPSEAEPTTEEPTTEDPEPEP